MADLDISAINDIIEKGKEADEVMKDLGSSTKNFEERTISLNSTLSYMTGTLDKAEKFIDSYKMALSENNKFSEQQVASLSLLSTALGGTSKAFSEFTAQRINSEGFVSQINFIANSSDDTKTIIGQLGNYAKTVFGKDLPDSVTGSVNATKSFVMNLAQSADFALALQKNTIGLAASTGSLNTIFASSGENLENINTLLSSQVDMISKVSSATGLGAGDVIKYYNQLGIIPKSLESIVSGTSKSGTQMNMLAATIKVASGTGRDFGSVVNDLEFAFKNYGLTGENALRFSTRISDVSNNLGLSFSEVQQTLDSSAKAFAQYADAGERSLNISEGLAKTTSDLAQSLMQTGLSGSQALPIVSNFTNQISNLTIAQKAFLSAQTGGAGGLMGAFQIEKQLREGDFAGVFDKVRSQMQKQLGSIVTLDEAASSQAAAGQLTRQMQIIKSGPLGQFARNDQEAYRLLEALKNNDAKSVQKTPTKDPLSIALDRGTAIQEKSYTQLSSSRALLEKIAGTSAVVNLEMLQRATTISSGKVTDNFSDRQSINQKNLKKDMLTAAQSTAASDSYTQQLKNKAFIKSTEDVYSDATKDIVGKIKEMPNAGKAAIDGFSRSLMGAPKMNLNQEYESVIRKIQEKRDQIKLDPKNTENINEYKDLMNKKTNIESNIRSNMFDINQMNELRSKPNDINFNQEMNKATLNKNTNEKTEEKHIHTKENINVGLEIRGYCISCGMELDQSKIRKLSPTANATSGGVK